MDATPWLGPGLFTLGGVLIATSATTTLGLLNRRTERRRLARDQKVTAYPDLIATTSRLADLKVWPADQEPTEIVAEVEQLTARIAFFGPAAVNATLGPVLATTRTLAEVVMTIRATSTAGHGGRIDQRLAPQHRQAVDALRDAVTRFVIAARVDLEVGSPYRAIDTEGSQSVTPGMIARSQEPGAS